MFKNKKYKCTMKVKRQFQKADSLKFLAEMYVEENNHEMAKRTTLEREMQKDKAWSLVYELHPILKNKSLMHVMNGNYVKIIKED